VAGSAVPTSPVRVACIQMEPVVGDIAGNVAKSVSMAEQAIAKGARLLVLPELSNSGYVFESRDEAFGLAETIPEGEASKAWTKLCAESASYLVAGIAERDGDVLYNSSVVFGPRGHVGTFRKVHLWENENLFFEPGNLGFPVFKTSIGRIGTFICYDGWFPESYRLCAAQGADILCIPTNWVPIPGQEPGQRSMANILCMANAHSNSVYIAAADRIGVERGQPFLGESVIVSYTGWPISGPASPDREEIIYADLDLSEARTKRNWNALNQPLRDRRRDVYDEMLGSGLRPGWY